MPRVAILGAGISGLCCAWQLLRERPELAVTVFEASARTGGIVETRREQGFTVELGPDSWVTEKPAARELVRELGLEDELLPSQDEGRVTHLYLNGRLEQLPSSLRMMVPLGREALEQLEASGSALFSPAMLRSFRSELGHAAELRRGAPLGDESIAAFTLRHFGREVLDRLAAPLLSGVFGGDVRQLSAHAVMAPFVAMEREHGSLIAALGEREAELRAASLPQRPIFTTVRSGLGTVTDALTNSLPPDVLRLRSRVLRLQREPGGWSVTAVAGEDKGQRTSTTERYDAVVLALPPYAAARLLLPVDGALARLIPSRSSSAILVAFGWPEATFAPPPGFGLLVPPSRRGEARTPRLLAATFVDQKFAGRVPPGGRLLRAFFGTDEANRLLRMSDRAVTQLALRELDKLLLPSTGPLPQPALTTVSRWPGSLPQYGVGHLEQVALVEQRLGRYPGLHLLGNALHGVGLPDLIRRARALARQLGDELHPASS